MRLLVATLVTMAVFVGACGDDATPTSTSTEILDPHGPPFGAKVTARDFAFEPSEWVVPSGALLILDFQNEGAVEHYFVVVAEGHVESAADLDDSMVFRELRAGPGELVSDSFLAPNEPGTYQVICKVPGHLEAGMTGQLVVER